MSKYVTHSHGLVIGSSNEFSFFDLAQDNETYTIPEGVKEFRSGYRAIVTPNGYVFDQINMINVMIRTPAQQIIWDFHEETVMEPYRGSLSDITELPRIYHWCTLSDFFVRWLNQNVGAQYSDWDVCGHACHRGDDCIFFKRRKDALAFVKEVNRLLTGIKIKF